MSTLQAVEKVVKDYFDNALIIDDELDLCKINEFDKITPVSDDEINYDELEDLGYDLDSAEKQVSATLEEYKQLPNNQNVDQHYSACDVFKAFVEEGFIILPWKYEEDGSENPPQILNNVLKNTKLLIIDWNLENTNEPQYMGDLSLQILSEFTAQKKGLKCAVIYTHQDLAEVEHKLSSQNYKCEYIPLDTQTVIYFSEENTDVSPLFGFVMEKSISPIKIIENISHVLLENKSITIHLMQNANVLDQNINEVLTEFNVPFEQVLASQIVSSEMNNYGISSFFNETLTSNLLRKYQHEENSNFFLYVKKQRLIKILSNSIPEQKINELIEVLNINGLAKNEIPNLIKNNEFITSLIEKISSEKINSFIELNKVITETAMSYLTNSNNQNPNNIEKFKRNLFLFFILLEYYLEVGNPEQFKNVYNSQIYKFTKLIKFKNYNSETIETGSIIKNINDGSYLLCITPICDTVRLNEIGDKLKFIIGEKITQLTKEEELRNSSNKTHIMTIINPSNKNIEFIRWKFYDTVTIPIEELNDKSIYRYICTLKQEYAQKVMNLYISYQSRAGVEELFYKESAYIKNFFEFIKN
jgi:Response receiver domain